MNTLEVIALDENGIKQKIYTEENFGSFNITIPNNYFVVAMALNGLEVKPISPLFEVEEICVINQFERYCKLKDHSLQERTISISKYDLELNVQENLYTFDSEPYNLILEGVRLSSLDDVFDSLGIIEADQVHFNGFENFNGSTYLSFENPVKMTGSGLKNRGLTRFLDSGAITDFNLDLQEDTIELVETNASTYHQGVYDQPDLKKAVFNSIINMNEGNFNLIRDSHITFNNLLSIGEIGGFACFQLCQRSTFIFPDATDLNLGVANGSNQNNFNRTTECEFHFPKFFETNDGGNPDPAVNRLIGLGNTVIYIDEL